MVTYAEEAELSASLVLKPQLRVLADEARRSSRQQETTALEECAILGRPVPTLDGRCRPAGAVEWDHGLARGAPSASREGIAVAPAGVTLRSRAVEGRVVLEQEGARTAESEKEGR